MLVPIKAMNERIDTPIIVGVSTGRDSLVMLDLFIKYYKRPFIPMYFYTFKGLSIHEDILQHYENKYNLKIEREPSEDWFNMHKIKCDAFELYKKIKAKYDCKYIALGYRKDENLLRRMMMSKTEETDGINYRDGVLYPLLHFNKKLVEKYVKNNKIKLPETYKYGFRDIQVSKENGLLWIYNNKPDDYRKMVEQYPTVQAWLAKATNYED